MKVAITGKGGVGKTTLSSTLARLYADEGRTVLAADVDPDANLGLALGLSQQEVDEIVPISRMKDLAKERTGASDDNKFYKLNPYVADIPEKFARTVNGVKLLVMGTVDLGVKQVRVVANKVRDEQDEAFVRSAIPAEDLLGIIHYNPEVMDADRQGKSPYDFSPTAIDEIRKIKAVLDRDA